MLFFVLLVLLLFFILLVLFWIFKISSLEKLSFMMFFEIFIWFLYISPIFQYTLMKIFKQPRLQFFLYFQGFSSFMLKNFKIFKKYKKKACIFPRHVYNNVCAENKTLIKCARLAQLVEHLTLNQGVQGSNPWSRIKGTSFTDGCGVGAFK